MERNWRRRGVGLGLLTGALVLGLWYVSMRAEPLQDPAGSPPASVAPTQREADEFAQHALEAMRAAGVRGELRYDPEHFTLHVPELEGQSALTISLSNFYDEYRASPPEQRMHALERLARFSASQPKGPTTYAAARSALLPVVRPRSYFELLKLGELGSPKDGGVGSGEVPVVWRPLGEVLSVALVLDTEEAMKYVSPEDLSKWGATFEQASADALENLRRKSSEDLETLAPGTCRARWGDSYASSRLVLDEVVGRCPVQGEPVVLVPNRDELLVTGSKDDEGLFKVAEWALAAYEAPRPVDGRALRRTAQGWVPFLPPKGSKSWPAFRKLLVESQQRDYAAQGAELDQRNQQQGVDVFVAEFIPYQDEHGNVFSQATWIRGSDTLLPRVDMVIFMDSEKGPEAPPVAVVRWEVVERDVGALLSPVEGLYPVRYRLKGFPSEAQLARWKKDPSVMDVP